MNTNGVLSFNSPNPSTRPRDFPFNSPPLIAPYFHDVDLNSGGTIFYRQTTDDNHLSSIGTFINLLTELSDFNPSLLFVATWFQVAPYSGTGEIGQNTFQAVLATDGETSIVGFIYGDIQWGQGAEIGFNAGDGVSFLSVPPSGVDTRDIETQSNVGVRGVFIYQVDGECGFLNSLSIKNIFIYEILCDIQLLGLLLSLLSQQLSCCLHLFQITSFRLDLMLVTLWFL